MGTAVVLVTGFMQPPNRSNSLADLHERLKALPDVTALLVSYKDDAASVAKYIAYDVEPTSIFVTGHSKGGLWGRDLCCELRDCMREVDALVLADAWNWKRQGPIVIPSNVKRLWSYRQSNNRPRGSDLELEDAGRTEWVVDERDVPDVKHAAMDEYVCNLDIVWGLVT